jgi:hypothetical protein
MSGFTIELSGLKKTLNELKKVQTDISMEVDAEIAAGVRKMEASAKRLAPKDKGFLSGRISAGRVEYLTWELVSQSDYAAFMEFGTKDFVSIPPGLQQYASQFQGKGRKGNRKLKEVIYEWAKRKGIPKEKWWFIYKQIAEKGVKPHPYFFPSVYAYRPEIIKNIIKLLREKR